MPVQIVRLSNCPEKMEQAAQWFHEKWKIPIGAYRERMEACLQGVHPVPQWYLGMEGDRMIAGLGVIENDFHVRKDLAPNLCAVYAEPEKRCQGIAGALLQYACDDMKRQGIDTLYLLTDHTGFYERYGFQFLCMVQQEGAHAEMTRLYVHKA